MTDLFDFYPYAERLGVNRTLPERGRSREEILSELRAIAPDRPGVASRAARRRAFGTQPIDEGC